MTRGFVVVKDKHRTTDGEIKLPVRSDPRSAGYDFYSPVDIVIPPNESKLFFTDVKAYMEDDEVLMLYVRSSMGKVHVVIANGTGIIDASYYNNPDNDGNIGFRLLNLGKEDYVIRRGDRIGQGVFMKYLITDDDNATGDRTGGFGSSGK
jgi:dUTP pyrophosphatase